LARASSHYKKWGFLELKRKMSAVSLQFRGAEIRNFLKGMP